MSTDLSRWWRAAGPLIAAGALVAPVVGGLSDARAQQELRVMTWEGYADDEWTKPFEQEQNVTVARTYVGSNDEYMAKLAAGGGDYDVVVIVSSLARRAIEAGFVEPLDLSLIPNFKDAFPRFQVIEFDRRGDEVYGVPMFWGINPVTVNAEVIPEGDDFGILFDEKYAGKIAMWDDVITIGQVASYMGFKNIWDLDDAQLEAVKKKMIEQKRLVRKYWSKAGEAIELFASGEIVASNSWSSITTELARRNFKVRQFYITPALGWVDSLFVVKGSRNRELAHKYINHMLDPKMNAIIAERSGYNVPNPLSRPHMNPEVWERLYMDEGPQMLQDMHFWEDIPRRAKYLELWNEVKAAPVQ